MFSKKTDVDKLHQKSMDVHNIFTQTVVDLKKINEQAHTAIQKKEAEKEELEEDIFKLDRMQMTNEKVIDKITSIFE